MLYFRIIDVNANRAREATRVIEDYARFILEDAVLSAKARSIRHQLVNILKPCARQMLASRDIQADIGKETATSAKTTAEIVISNLRRLSESLRSISEYSKTIIKDNLCKSACTEQSECVSSVVRDVERLRFEAYQLEQEFSFILYPNKAFDKVRLYVLVPGIRNDKIIRDLIKGGAGAIQLRVNTPSPFPLPCGERIGEGSGTESLTDKKLLELAVKFRKITRAHQALFIINNRIDIALLSNADGVHLGATDCSVRDARKILGPDKIIGATSHSIAEALDAQRNGADYVSVGPMFSSPTKPHLALVGFSYLKEVARKIHIPYVAIGGITARNLPVLLKAHKRLFKEPLKIAVSSGILNSKNVSEATRRINKILNHKGH
ncbi:MAG: thiamine phosphate synthase [Planctomycetes bacterium]|nr:thiamine phosphate synthase [Planctomycetota bacterium]